MVPVSELTIQEIEILAVLAINAIESELFSPGVGIHPTILDRLTSAHSKLVEALENRDGLIDLFKE